MVSDETSTERRTDTGGFGGLRVVAFESRMAADTARLIERAGGIAISAPSMREIPIDENPATFAFATSLLAGRYDVVIFLTGVGTRLLFDAMETRHDRAALVAAVSKTCVVARGPKPVRVLRELGIPITVTVPEPNTWREMLITLEESAEGVALDGARVAVQEYGVTNDRLIDGLAERGASVTTVPVYRWALPEDRRPLVGAIHEIIARTADVTLFTSATQAHHVLRVARDEGLASALTEALGEVCVCSIGPVCSETLVELGIGVDHEPVHPKLGILIKEAGERCREILARKRAIRRQSRVSLAPAAAPPALDVADSAFMRACRREPTSHTPVWLMRQAGRYMQEYREMRARLPFIELCKRPDLAAEVAVTAARRIGADAAILFSDILLIVEPMGLGLEYVRGEGPSLSRGVRSAADVDRLRRVDPVESLAYVFDAVRITRRELDPHLPLIGFSGAPFTLASYIVEGGGSRSYVETKTFMYRDAGAWHAMMELIADAVGRYLCGQIEAGCQAVQLFDSWVGCLSPDDYERYVLRHTEKVFSALPADVPAIHFGTDTATLLDLQLRAGGTVIGLDHRTPIGAAFDRHGGGVAIQGNLDPAVLFADRQTIRDRCKRILDEVGGRRGHIFNLGHGILPATPVDNVIALVDAIHELSAST